MKSTTVAIFGALAAVASAYSPAKHLHFPRANATTTAASTPAAELTTLTVKTTETKTIVSCAPTVTNCPADEKGMSDVPEKDRTTQVVTNTVVLTETVCPVTEVERVSSKVVQEHATPAPTAHPTMTTKVVDVTMDKTVTITLGVGASQSVVPTVIKSTSKSTVTVPSDEEPTTTTTATSTSTRTVTVAPAKDTQTVAANGNEGCDKAPAETVTVTVAQTTVTAPAATVYVTVPCDSAAPAVTGKAGGDKATNDKHTNNNGGDKKGNDNGDNKGEDNKPAQTTDCPPDETTTIQEVVTVVPYPTGSKNGTTTGAAAPSGFARLRR